MLQNSDLPHKQPATTTQRYLPLYRKMSGLKKQSQQATIAEDHQTIISKLNQLQKFFDNRMSVHECQLFNVMKLQVLRILQNLTLVINNYNKMMMEKNLSQELWEIRNQVEYFKYQSLRLYKENNMLKKKLENYQHDFKRTQFQSLCKEQALKRMAHKLAKSKAKNKISVEKSRRYNSVILCSLDKSRQTQQDTEAQCNAVTKQLQKNLIKIDKKYSIKSKFNTKTQADEKTQNPEEKSRINMPFLQSRQDRIKVLKQKISSTRKARN